MISLIIQNSPLFLVIIKMEDIKLELEKLQQEIIQDDSDSYDIRADENDYLDSLEDDAWDDMDSLINWFLFF